MEEKFTFIAFTLIQDIKEKKTVPQLSNLQLSNFVVFIMSIVKLHYKAVFVQVDE